MPSKPPLTRLSERGVSIWLDDLSRERLTSGNLAELIRDYGIVGVTANPSIFAAALADGQAYTEQVRQLAIREATVAEAIREITVADVRQACDVFEPVWRATDGVDGRVSLEVDPGLAHDTGATVEQARQLWRDVDRPNLLVKIPATEAGMSAITATIAHGISVNVTLIFSIERYRAVMSAYLQGLTQALDNGHALAGIHSVASFFVSRVDAEVDTQLEVIGTDDALALRGRAAVANARLAYAAHQEVFTGQGWATLSAHGARTQRPLWASTGTKNPNYPDTLYVSELVIADTVNTMPEKTLRAFADHGHLPAGTATHSLPDARDALAVFDALSDVGIDIAEIFLNLESDGVGKFIKSWDELTTTVQDQLDRAG